jgi:hypothetical protein
MSSSTTPPAPHSAVKSLVAPPPKFSGDKDKYETFIRGVRLYIQGNPSLDTDEKKIITVLSFLEGGYAEVWANSQTDIAFAKPTVDFGKWSDFLKELEKQFAKTTKESDAITSLEALYQEKLTADEYWLRFDALRIKSGYQEVADYQHLRRIVMSHMNRPLVTQVFGMKLADQPKTLAEWRDKTISFDRSWRECRDIFAQQKRSTTQYYSRAEPSTPSSTNTTTPKKTYYENVPMDVDRRQAQPNFSRQRMTDSERQEHMKKGACFNCHETGHLSRNCPKKANTTLGPKQAVRSMETTPAPKNSSDDKDALIASLMDRIEAMERTQKNREDF